MTQQESNNKSLLPWITTVLMVTGIAVVAALYWNRNVTVQEFKVSGIEFTELEEVQKAAAVSMGIKPDSVDLESLVYRVEQLDYVKSVIPFVEPNGDLKLDITERKPLALLVQGSNRMYVDEEGVKLPVLEGKTEDVPLLYGYNATSKNDTLKSESFQQVRDFLIQARKNSFGWVTISEIAFDENDGVVALSHENGVKLIFGRNGFATKLENWEAFYSEVIRVKGIQAMQQVDLRFANQVVTREI